MLPAMTRRAAIFGGLVWLAVTRGFAANDAGLRVSTAAVRREVIELVNAQLAAFREGDAEKAYTYAAAELRAQKPLRAFTAIVRGNYPEIWQSTRAEFGIVRDDGRRAVVSVQVDSKDSSAEYEYTLKKERAGWRVFGVLRGEGGTAKRNI